MRPFESGKMMEFFNEIEPLRAFLAEHHSHKSIGLVPTMGALHEGHLSLVKAARSENDITVCSIFVNPTQFNNPADLAAYPRTLEHDMSLLEKAGCDVIFAPTIATIYPTSSTIKFDFGSLDKILEGKFRPGHFSGVAQIVAKLFNIIQPTRAYFGQKDFQQLKIVETLVRELNFPIAIRPMPILREADGLAMSSRNLRLTPAQRKQALILYESLTLGKKLLAEGQPFAAVHALVERKWNEALGVTLEYFELVNSGNLEAEPHVTEQSILLIAGTVGEIRLIDNLRLT